MTYAAKRRTIEAEAIRRVAQQASQSHEPDREVREWVSRAGLRAALNDLNGLIAAADRAYQTSDSPHDQHGNPTDYSGEAHQTLLRCGDIRDDLEAAASIIRKVLDRAELGD